MFCRGEGTGDNVPPDTGCRTSEDQCSPFPKRLLNLVFFEFQDSLPRKGERSGYVGLEQVLNFAWGGVKEPLPNSCSSVVDGYTN